MTYCTSFVVGHADRAAQLGREGTSTLVLSMMTARAAAAVRRVRLGQPIDNLDHDAIHNFSARLSLASAALRSTPTALPTTDVSALLDVAQDAFPEVGDTALSQEDTAQLLDEWANDLLRVDAGDADRATHVHDRLLLFLDVINSTIGSSGESPTAF